MNLTQLITCIAIFFVMIIWQADYQALRFKNNKPISHIGKSVIYCIACIIVGICFVYGRWNSYYWYWQVPLLAVFTRVAFFDIILNDLRHNAWYYVGRGTTGSIQSKFLAKFTDYFIKIWRYVFIGLWIAVVAVIIWYYKKHQL